MMTSVDIDRLTSLVLEKLDALVAAPHCQRDPVICRYRHGWIPIIPIRGDRVRLNPDLHGGLGGGLVKDAGTRSGKPYFDAVDTDTGRSVRVWPEGTPGGREPDQGWELVADPDRRPRDMDDAELDRAMQIAAEGGDFGRFDALAAEADARDTRKAAQRQRAEQVWAKYEQLSGAGVPDDEAFAEASGISLTQLRRNEAITSLRDAGYRGRDFEELARQSYRDEVAGRYFRAEAETRGHLLTREAQGRGVDPRGLFSGPEARARRWASDELKQWWDDNGRLTFDQYREQLLGGTGRRARGADTDFLT